MTTRRLACCGLLVIAVVVVGCGDAHGPGLADGSSQDSGIPADGGGLDAARPADGGDAGGRDAGPGGGDAGHDGGAMVCRGPGDCPPGRRCEGGVCVVEPGCCATVRCGPGTTCDPTTCTCGGGSGCCATGTCDDPMKYCDFGTCGCVSIPECVPACGDGFVCEWGMCTPRCYIEGCPVPTDVCTETGECVPPRCTSDECVAMTPPLRCDPAVGCVDPCASGDWSWCTMLGGACYLGECVDATCGESRGLPRVDCGFTADCCGEWYCMRAGDPPPPCPFMCPTPPPGGIPMPDAGLCVCGVGGGIIIGGGGDPGGGGGTPGGGPPPPPPPGGDIYCIDLRASTGGGPVPPPRPIPAL